MVRNNFYLNRININTGLRRTISTRLINQTLNEKSAENSLEVIDIRLGRVIR